MQKHPTHKNTSGFTLIELLIVRAIIGILAAIAIPQFNQYKVRGYDAHSKQALQDILLHCNAFWLDMDASQGCDLSIIEEVAYGFRQVPEVKAILSPSPLDNFCASAKHESSPNTYSIDGASVMSEGGDCGGTGGSVQTASAGGSVKTASVSPAQTFEDYQAPEIACKTQRGEPYHTAAGISGRKYVVGAWIIVDSKGRQVEGTGGSVCSCDVCGPGGSFYAQDGIRTQPRPNNYKYVFVNPASTWDEEQGVFVGNVASMCSAQGRPGCTYDFATNTYLDGSGRKRDINGKVVE